MREFDGERRVEEMIARGRRVVNEALSIYRPAAVIAAFSGGNDSVVSTHFACAERGAAVVHCDTLTGLEMSQRHAMEAAGKLRWSLDVRRAEPEGPGDTKVETLPRREWLDGGTAYEEYVFNQGLPGPGQHQRMYQRLKERLIRRVARELAPRGEKVLIVSGIRHDESAVRAGYRRAIQAQPKTKLVWVNPFYWQDAADFEAYRDEFGLPRNPAKAMVGISGECLCGAFAVPGEKELVRAAEPRAAAYLDGLEQTARGLGFPWGWGERPPRWWVEQKRGQGLLFPMDDPADAFHPMCVGCVRKSARTRV